MNLKKKEKKWDNFYQSKNDLVAPNNGLETEWADDNMYGRSFLMVYCGAVLLAAVEQRDVRVLGSDQRIPKAT